MLTHVHTALVANEIPLLLYEGIRIPRLRSHIVSTPTDQRNAITGGARNRRVPLARI